MSCVKSLSLVVRSHVQPLEIDEFVAELQNVGIKISSKDVIDYLDEQVCRI